MRPIALVFEAADGRPLAATVLEPRRVAGRGGDRQRHRRTPANLRGRRRLPRRCRPGGPHLRLPRHRRLPPGRLAAPRGRHGCRTGGGSTSRARWGGCAGRTPALPLMVLGHSAGGQLLGLAPSARHLAGAALVGSQLGWAGHWPWPARAVMWSTWHGLIPALTSVTGYLPMQRARTGRGPPGRRGPGVGGLGPAAALPLRRRSARRSARATRRCASRCGRSTSPTTSTPPGAGWRPWSPSTEARREVHTVSPAEAASPAHRPLRLGPPAVPSRRSGRPSATGSSSGSCPRRFAAWAELLDV